MSGSSNGEPPKNRPPDDQQSVNESTQINAPTSDSAGSINSVNPENINLDSVVDMGSINMTEPATTDVISAAPRNQKQAALLEVNESAKHIRVRNMSTPKKDERSFVRGRLVVVSDADQGIYVYLDGPLLNIGRGRDADVMVLDEGVSRLHARLIRHDEGFRIVDAESENGTYLNGRSIKEAELYDGDVIGLGQTRLQYEGVGWQRRLVDRPSMVHAVFRQRSTGDGGTRSIWPNLIVATVTTFLIIALIAGLKAPKDPMVIAQAWYQRAQTSVSEARWRDARDEIEIAKVLGLDKSSYQILLDQVETHMVDEELAHMVRGSIIAGQPLSTIQTLSDRVSKDSPISKELEALINTEIDRRTTRWFRDARRATLAGEKDLAIRRIERVLELRPKNEQANLLMESLKGN